jgi:hypothetical protein
VEVAGKASDHTQPECAPAWTAAVRQGRPRQGNFNSDDLGAGLVTEVDELREKVSGPLELVAELPAHGQVVIQRLSEGTHASPPGHGRASAESVVRSTFA